MLITYNQKLKQYAKDLRKNSTLSEVLLWKRINKGKIKGFDFHRQKPIDKYIVDFFCPKLMLAIEIDGNTHFQKEGYDEMREKDLNKIGIRVLKFGDSEVKRNIGGVVMAIESWIEENSRFQNSHTPPSGHPSREGI